MYGCISARALPATRSYDEFRVARAYRRRERKKDVERVRSLYQCGKRHRGGFHCCLYYIVRERYTILVSIAVSRWFLSDRHHREKNRLNAATG